MRHRRGRLLATSHVRTLSKAYGLAVLVTLASVALTRVTWPFFSAAPFAPVFAAVAVSTHWGSGSAGLLAIVLAVAGTALAFPPTSHLPWNPVSLTVFAAVAIVGSRLIHGRNKATAALHAPEAELRAYTDALPGMLEGGAPAPFLPKPFTASAGIGAVEKALGHTVEAT